MRGKNAGPGAYSCILDSIHSQANAQMAAGCLAGGGYMRVQARMTRGMQMMQVTRMMKAGIVLVGACALALMLAGCTGATGDDESARAATSSSQAATGDKASGAADIVDAQLDDAQHAADLRAQLQITEDYRAAFDHGEKGPQYQRYIVLHDTESEADAASIVEYWDQGGMGVAAHFVVNRDGSIVQCVPLDRIAHHAGFGDTGHNERYGVTDESRDDKVGTVSIGADMADYGMNSYSVGIEMAHAAGQDYPAAQLAALDTLIAYINAYYGFESAIIDHKGWRTGNSDTSPQFAEYLANYQARGTHS